MAIGEVVIDPNRCRGCGYCVKFCPRGCIAIPGDKLSAEGYTLAVFSRPENCNACGACGWLCPHFALEVYKYIDAKPAAAGGVK